MTQWMALWFACGATHSRMAPQETRHQARLRTWCGKRLLAARIMHGLQHLVHNIKFRKSPRGWVVGDERLGDRNPVAPRTHEALLRCIVQRVLTPLPGEGAAHQGIEPLP